MRLLWVSSGPATAHPRPCPRRGGAPGAPACGLRVGPASYRTGRVLCPAPGAGRASRAQPPASIFWAVLCGAAAGLAGPEAPWTPGENALAAEESSSVSASCRVCVRG